jgi:hypothetical protein
MLGLSKESRLLNPDFRDILSVFLEEGVEFLVVGGYAVAAHGLPRATKDIDLWVGCSPANASRVITALKRFGAAVSEIREKDFLQPGITFQIGIPPRRIDIITEIEGVQFQDAYPNRISANLEGISVPVISRSDLLTNKRTLGRPQDLVDATWLAENED